MTAIYPPQWTDSELDPERVVIPAPTFDFSDTEHILTRVPMGSIPDLSDMDLMEDDKENVIIASRINMDASRGGSGKISNIRHLLHGQVISIVENTTGVIPSERLNRWLQTQTRLPYDDDDHRGMSAGSAVIYKRPEKKRESRYKNEDKVMWALNEKINQLSELSDNKWKNAELKATEKKVVWDIYKEITEWQKKELSPSNKARLEHAVILMYTCLDDVSHVKPHMF